MPKAITVLVLLSIFPVTAVADCVVLLHGLGRLSNSMSELESKLAPAGYSVANIKYPSRSFPIEILAEDAIGRGLAQCRDEMSEEGEIHFITHSLGGILLRFYLSQQAIANLGRVVMLGPPNQGSEIVDGLLPVPGFGFIGGPAGLALGTGGIINQLGPVEFDLGVIAGSTNINPLEFLFIEGPSDSIVSIESTKVNGMNAHKVLPVTHTFMMRNSEVIEQAIHYLKTGTFFPDSDADEHED